MSTDKSPTPAQIFASMPNEMNAEKAKGINATFQFELAGKNGGIWAVSIADGRCAIENQPAANPHVTIKMTDDDFVALAVGKLQAVPAFISGKVRVYGDYVLATKLPVLFES
jgi:putative sterol carrier protein